MTETVSKISDLAFLLSDNPAMINTIPPQQLLHALLPQTANKNKIMPKNSSFADTWMLKRGNPLHSIDSALALVKQINPELYVHMDLYSKHNPFAALFGSDDMSEPLSESISETLPGAILIALLNYVAEMKKDDIA